MLFQHKSTPFVSVFLFLLICVRFVLCVTVRARLTGDAVSRAIGALGKDGQTKLPSRTPRTRIVGGYVLTDMLMFRLCCVCFCCALCCRRATDCTVLMGRFFIAVIHVLGSFNNKAARTAICDLILVRLFSLSSLLFLRLFTVLLTSATSGSLFLLPCLRHVVVLQLGSPPGKIFNRLRGLSGRIAERL